VGQNRKGREACGAGLPIDISCVCIQMSTEAVGLCRLGLAGIQGYFLTSLVFTTGFWLRAYLELLTPTNTCMWVASELGDHRAPNMRVLADKDKATLLL
jgi:hypothetical protein